MKPQLAKTDIVELPDSTIDSGQNTAAISGDTKQFETGETTHHQATELCPNRSLTKIEHLLPTRVLTHQDSEHSAITNILDDVLMEARLDFGQVNRLLRESPEFKEGFHRLIRAYANPQEFISEETSQSHGYHGGYQQPKPLSEQADILLRHFPGIGKLNAKQMAHPVHPFAEGPFVVINFRRIGDNYEEALLCAFNQLKLAYGGKFRNCLEGKLGPNRFQLNPRTETALQKLIDQQMNLQFIVMNGQFGQKHGGRSVRRVHEVMYSYEFGTDPLSVACMLLTHPERLSHEDDLCIDCAGAHYDTDRNGQFESAPFFMLSQGEIRFDAGSIKHHHLQYGSSSFFVEDC